MRSRSRSLSSLLLVVVGLLATAPATAATLFISNTKGESISVIDTTTFEVTATIPLGKGKPNRVVFHPDGKTAWVVYDKSHDLGVVDADAHKLIKRVKIGGNPYNLNFTPDGRQVVATAYGSLRCWEVASAKVGVVFEWPKTGYSWSVAIAPDGGRVIVGSDGGMVRIFDMKTGKLVQQLEGHTDSVWGVALLADGKRAVTGSWDRSLRVWDVDSGKQIRAFEKERTVFFREVTED